MSYTCSLCGKKNDDFVDCDCSYQDKKKSYTENDIKELDRIITRCESQNQMERIEGRMEYKKFASRFTEEELKEMAKKIGCSV